MIAPINGAPKKVYKTLYIAQLGTPAMLAQINIIRRSRESSSSIGGAPMPAKKLNMRFMNGQIDLTVAKNCQA
jgi:hypothetical protein